MSQEERVVGIKSETSVVDAQTSCLMQLSEPVEETTQETSAKIEEKNSKLVTRLTQVQNPVLNHIWAALKLGRTRDIWIYISYQSIKCGLPILLSMISSEDRLTNNIWTEGYGTGTFYTFFVLYS